MRTRETIARAVAAISIYQRDEIAIEVLLDLRDQNERIIELLERDEKLHKKKLDELVVTAEELEKTLHWHDQYGHVEKGNPDVS